MKRLVFAFLVLTSPCFRWQRNSTASKMDTEHTEWIHSVLRTTISIRPGMTRGDLLRVFTTEGGLATRSQRTYVYKTCPYIKVAVEFEPVEKKDDHTLELPSDRITKISRPYLEFSVLD